MGFETDIGGLRLACGINDRKRTLAVAHEYPLAPGVYSHVRSSVAELDASDRRQIVTPQHPHRAITGICYKDAIGERDIGNALWLAQTVDPPQHLARCQIDHAEAVVAELGHEQPLALHIDTEVVDAAAHITERNLRLEHERRARRRLRHHGVTTISMSALPHLEQTSRSRQSGTGVSAPYRAAIAAGSGST